MTEELRKSPGHVFNVHGYAFQYAVLRAVYLGETPLTEKKWVYYQYGQSPDLKHSHSTLRDDSDISEILYLDDTRTIPIVNSAAISDFLSNGFWQDPDDWQTDLPSR